jgi:hypothetical protein
MKRQSSDEVNKSLFASDGENTCPNGRPSAAASVLEDISENAVNIDQSRLSEASTIFSQASWTSNNGNFLRGSFGRASSW